MPQNPATAGRILLQFIVGSKRDINMRNVRGRPASFRFAGPVFQTRQANAAVSIRVLNSSNPFNDRRRIQIKFDICDKHSQIAMVIAYEIGHKTLSKRVEIIFQCQLKQFDGTISLALNQIGIGHVLTAVLVHRVYRKAALKIGYCCVNEAQLFIAQRFPQPCGRILFVFLYGRAEVIKPAEIVVFIGCLVQSQHRSSHR